MSSFFTLTELNYIQEKSQKFKYQSCAIYGDYAAFGTSAGSIHIFSLSQNTPPVVISLPSLISAVEVLSFSPSGKWLAMADSKGLHFIENPFEQASLFFSIDFKSSTVTAVTWISEPPGKLVRTPFFVAGDNCGQIWIIKHQNAELMATLPGPLIQLSMICENILASTRNGAFIIKEGSITSVGRKPPIGEFGAIYADGFNAICVGRQEGKLSFASPEGRIKASISFAQNENEVSTDFSHLMFCSPFLVSAWKNTLCYFIDLTSTSLIRATKEFKNVIDVSNDNTRILFLCSSKVTLFKVCSSNIEYINYLIDLNTNESLSEAQQIVIKNEITDEEILKKLSVGNGLDEYIQKLEMKNQPKTLDILNNELYEKLKNEEIPSQETMNEINNIRQYLVMDNFILLKIEKYVIANPKDYETWINEINPDVIVPILNSNESTALYSMKIAKYGKSDLCKLLNNLDTLSIDFCVANSPPIYPYNFTGEKRKEFEEKLKKCDIFAETEPEKPNQRKMIESFYNDLYDKTDENNIEPSKAYYLLRLYEWEAKISDLIDEIKHTVNMYLLTQDEKDIPGWVLSLISSNKEIEKDGDGNWGILAQMSICPICGMTHDLGESLSNVSVFPCGHICHVSCLHTLYCPICYSQILK